MWCHQGNQKVRLCQKILCKRQTSTLGFWVMTQPTPKRCKPLDCFLPEWCGGLQGWQWWAIILQRPTLRHCQFWFWMQITALCKCLHSHPRILELDHTQWKLSGQWFKINQDGDQDHLEVACQIVYSQLVYSQIVYSQIVYSQLVYSQLNSQLVY